MIKEDCFAYNRRKMKSEYKTEEKNGKYYVYLQMSDGTIDYVRDEKTGEREVFASRTAAKAWETRLNSLFGFGGFMR